jgi:hypothetical protein
MLPSKQFTVPMPGTEPESVDMVGEWECAGGTTTISSTQSLVSSMRRARRPGDVKLFSLPPSLPCLSLLWFAEVFVPF